MAKSEVSRIRSVSLDVVELRKHMWAMLATGLVIGFLVMHLVIERPLQRRMNALRKEMATLQQDTINLAGNSMNGYVTEVNNLLSHLKSQQSQIKTARTALKDIRQFRTEVIRASCS